MQMKKNQRGIFLLAIVFLLLPCFLSAQALGDVNNSGSIDIVDALLIAQYYVGITPVTFYQNAADTNGDGSISIVDALLIAQYYVGIITTFPAGTPVPTPIETTSPTAVTTAPPGGPTGNLPWLHTAGKYIKDANGNNAALYGVDLPDIKTLIEARTIPGDASLNNIQRYIEKATNKADGWYSNVVRLAVYPDTYTDETGTHSGWKQVGADAYFNTYLSPAVDYCITKQVYAIIDWHYVGASWTDSNVKSNTDAFWSYVPSKYSNCSNVLFEIMNEPSGSHSQADWNSWKSAADAWVSMIRSAAPNNLILVGSPSWSQNLTYVSQNPISGSNIVYVCHVYPQHAQSNWDSWFGNTANSYPVFMSEWGYQSGGSDPTNGTESSYGQPFKNYINSHDNIRWTAWAFDYIWQPVMWDSNWNLKTGTSYEGQFVKTWIDEKL
jgi:endoglucanase